jgi:hypothetical protein
VDASVQRHLGVVTKFFPALGCERHILSLPVAKLNRILCRFNVSRIRDNIKPTSLYPAYSQLMYALSRCSYQPEGEPEPVDLKKDPRLQLLRDVMKMTIVRGLLLHHIV